MGPSRQDDFSKTIKETLAKRVGLRCSNPVCRRLTGGPRSDPNKTTNIGVAAHITAAQVGGPRYDRTISSEERRSIANGIWLCQGCAKLVDNDEALYTVDCLREWKRLAEETTRREVEGRPEPAAVAGAKGASGRRALGGILPVWKSSSFLGDDDVVATTLPELANGLQTDILWKNRPQAFLRVIPEHVGREWSQRELLVLLTARGVALPPFGASDCTWQLHNRFGAVVLNATQPPQVSADCLTQVFKNGEIWGIDGWLLNDRAGKKPYIPSIATEKSFRAALRNYLQFAERALALRPPLKIVCGLSGVDGYSFALPSNLGGDLAGRAVEDEIISHAMIEAYSDSAGSAVLTQFFRCIWETCGLEYPIPAPPYGSHLAAVSAVPSEPRPLRAFLCHSSEDKAAVRRLHARLNSCGVHPWLDEVDLLAGQEWDAAIRAAIRETDVVLVCLSPASVTKSGYIQKEIRFALDVADEKPEGLIFLIPLRLAECGVPQRLRRWQWLDLFVENGYERLLIALQSRARELGLMLPTVEGAAAMPPQRATDDAQSLIVNAASVIDAPVERVEQIFGRAIESGPMGIGSAEEVPDGAESRTYRAGGYTMYVSFDKKGIAKGLQVVDGLRQHNYSLDSWPLVLRRLGTTVLEKPDIVAPASRRWTDYLGYSISVFADKIEGAIWSVRIYKMPR